MSFLAAALVAGGYGTLIACEELPEDPPKTDGGVDAQPIDAGKEATTPAAPDAAACASRRSDLDGTCNPLVFVTTTELPGDFGGSTGVAKGDAVCQSEADKVFTGKVFKAFLSGGGVSAKDRLEHSPTKYRLIDGTIVAANWDRFASPVHTGAIDLLLDGQRIKPSPVWTGTNPDGTESTVTCENWSTTDPAARGLVGFSANLTDGDWSDAPGSCASKGRLYCLEQLGSK